MRGLEKGFLHPFFLHHIPFWDPSTDLGWWVTGSMLGRGHDPAVILNSQGLCFGEKSCWRSYGQDENEESYQVLLPNVLYRASVWRKAVKKTGYSMVSPSPTLEHVWSNQVSGTFRDWAVWGLAWLLPTRFIKPSVGFSLQLSLRAGRTKWLYLNYQGLAVGHGSLEHIVKKDCESTSRLRGKEWCVY